MGPDQLLRQRTVTAVGERRSLAFEDGSSVELNTDTEIFWRVTKTCRKLWLTRGEAALAVVRDAARPFLLVTVEGIAELAEGQFNVRLAASRLNLVVLSGEASVHGRLHVATVSVNSPDAERKILTIAPKGVEVIPASETEVQSLQAWRRGEIIFDGMSLASAVDEYNRYLPRKLVVADSSIAGLHLGGRFLTNNPEGFLRALNASFGIRAKDDGSAKILLVPE